MRVCENFISRQVVGVLLLLLLSVTVFHMLFSATRAMSKVMVKLRRYHCLDIKSRGRRGLLNPVTSTDCTTASHDMRRYQVKIIKLH